MTLNALRFTASKKNPRVPVAHKHAGNDNQFKIPSSPDFATLCRKISRAWASLVAVNPPARDIWSISEDTLLRVEKS